MRVANRNGCQSPEAELLKPLTSTSCWQPPSLYIWQGAETTYLNVPISYHAGIDLQDCYARLILAWLGTEPIDSFAHSGRSEIFDEGQKTTQLRLSCPCSTARVAVWRSVCMRLLCFYYHKCPNWKRTKAFNLYWHSIECKAADWHAIQITHMLNNKYFCPQ